MDCQFIVRAVDGIWRWMVDDWTSGVLLASLSSEPETYDELAMAVRRFQSHPAWLADSQKLDDITVQDETQLWCVADLVGRTVVAGGGYELLDRRGCYRKQADEDEPSDAADTAEQQPSDGQHHHEHVYDSDLLWTNFPHRWSLETASEGWRERLEQRAEQRRSEVRFEARPVLFGRPLFEFLARNIVQRLPQIPNEDTKESYQAEYELARAIHAEWMLTPRADLGDRSPRATFMADHDFVQAEVETRMQQWSRQGFPPPPLWEQSAAYRYGGFGLAEFQMYFDLVRQALGTACRLARENPAITAERLTDRLIKLTEKWLDTVLRDEPHTPRQIILASRQRLPMVADSEPIDHDCPICRAEKEGLFGPTFLMFDGSALEMEEDIAFTLYDESEWEFICQRNEAIDKAAEEYRNSANQRAHAPDQEAATAAEEFSSVWKSSFTSRDHTDVPPTLARMMLSFPLAEIIEYLRKQRGGRRHVDAINEAFDNFRRATDLTAIQSNAIALRECLERAALSFPDLLGRSADFQSQLDEVLRAART